MSKDKGPDEIFCRSCGEPIKKAAEVCPNCGVRNVKSTSRSQGTVSGGTPGRHDPSQFETTVSENWFYLIGASVVLWVLALMISNSSLGSGGILDTLSSFFMLVAWVGMPLGMYYDKLYLRANSKWNPNMWLWVILAIIPIINIIAGVVFLYRRHEVLGTP